MVKGAGLTYFVNRGWVFERVGVVECRWVVKRGWAVVGDMVCEGGIVVGDVARERVGMVVVVSSLSLSLVSWYMGVASSLVTWHVRGWRWLHCRRCRW